nr:glycosyltransferase family 39 protein [Lachnospiraceae bacterium]
MDKICDFCNAQYDDSLDNCPHCGAPNSSVRRGEGVPRTIEELKKWYTDHNLPPEETTRFFIGTDYKKPKAFGIYKDGNSGDYVVYKNKADGSRAVRYQGKDESYAVNEIYQKLKDEIARQKGRNDGKRSSKRSLKKKLSMFWSSLGILIFGFLAALTFFGGFLAKYAIVLGVIAIGIYIYLSFKNGNRDPKPLITRSLLILAVCVLLTMTYKWMEPANKDGYYNIAGNTYYSRDDKWYTYDPVYDDWYYYGVFPDISEGTDYSDYYEGHYSYS